MKKKRFSEEQIVRILKEAESGKSVVEVCRAHGVSDATFYSWRKKYAGMAVPEVRKLKELEGENKRLKELLADTMLENAAIKDVLSRKW